MEYLMSSTARLSSQLKGVQGWAEVTFSGASLQIPMSSNLESIRCSLVANKQGGSITRNSSACQYSSDVQWNENVKFPCCLDWDIEFSVSAKSNRSKEVLAVSDILLIQSAGSISLPLSIGAKCVGELHVSLVFHPNFRSFKYLSIGCYLSEQLPYSLTNKILTDLKKSAVTMEDRNEKDVLNIISIVDNFTTFLTDEDVYYGELCRSLNINAHRQKGQKQNQGNDRGFEKSANRFESLLRDRKVSPPQLVAVPRVAQGAKTFLSKLLGDLPHPPPVTIELMEKLLNIHTQSLFVSDIQRSRQSSSIAAAGNEKDAEMSLTWGQFSQFCVTCALWFLQQAVSAHHLLLDCSNLTLSELDALRFGFSQYDADLSGIIPSSDLQSLLQDMGEEYTEAELGLTECFLDPDSVGVIDFAEFVQWWCE